MKSLNQLLPHIPNHTLRPCNLATLPTITDITSDNRKVTQGALFVAIQGRSSDGHRFIANAIERGAVAVIGTKSLEALSGAGISLPDAVGYIQVPDSRQALAYCCAAFHDFPSRDMVVIGITGTDGKTTTATILESILSVDDAVGVITTVGARIGGQEIDTGFHVTTPEAPEVQRFLAQMRDANCRYAIVESTSHGLEQARVAAVDYDIAAVTNITHEHIDYHGTRAAYVAAKALLFRSLYHSPPKPGMVRRAVLNADDAGSISALTSALVDESIGREDAVSILQYAFHNESADDSPRPVEVFASQIDAAPDQTRFHLQWWDGDFGIETSLIGDFNVQNILCAASIALALDVVPESIQRGVANLQGVVGRMERVDRGQPFLAVVDFAHSPASLERALVTLRHLIGQDEGRDGRLIAVFGSAGLRDVAKRELMGQVSGRLANFTVITAEDPRTEDLATINQAIAHGVRKFASDDLFVIVPDRTKAIQFAVDMARPGDVVVAFGKGHERSICFGEIEYPWSDQEAMATALENRFQNSSKSS